MSRASKTRRSAKAAEPLAIDDPSQVPWESLPDELYDLILNGADASGRGLLDPAERVLPCLVCRRWWRIVRNPSPQWAAGHLRTAWTRLRPFDRMSKSRERDRAMAAMIEGRLVSMRTLVLFLCGGSWQPGMIGKMSITGTTPASTKATVMRWAYQLDASDDGKGAVGDGSDDNGDNNDVNKEEGSRPSSRPRKRAKTSTTSRADMDVLKTLAQNTDMLRGTDETKLGVFPLGVLAESKVRAKQIQERVALFVRLTLGRDGAPLVRSANIDGAWLKLYGIVARYLMGSKSIHHLIKDAHGLAAKRLPPMMVHAGCAVDQILSIVCAVAQVSKHVAFGDVVDLARTWIFGAADEVRDNPEMLFAILNLLRHPCLTPTVKDEDHVQTTKCIRLWVALSDMGAVRCIHALSSVIDNEKASTRDTQAQEWLMASATHLPKASNVHPFANAGRVRQLLKRARSVATSAPKDGSHAQSAHRNYALPRSLSGRDPVGVLVAHGTTVENVHEPFQEVLWAGAFGLAERMLEFYPTLIALPHVMGPAIGKGRNHAAVLDWAVAKGYVPDAEAIKAIVDASVWTLNKGIEGLTTDRAVFAMLIERWPLAMLGLPDAIRMGVLRMVRDGRWGDADAILSLLWLQRTLHTSRLSPSDACSAWCTQTSTFTLPTLWVTLSTLAERVFRLTAAGPGDRLYPHGPLQRVAHGTLADRCDAGTNPGTWEAWCLWGGTPTPVEASADERHLLGLVQRGLLY